MSVHYVYVLQSGKSKRWYTGLTNDLRKRLRQHQVGETISTRNRGPWKLIYYEMSNSREDAEARELYLKSGMGKRYLKNRLKHFLVLKES